MNKQTKGRMGVNRLIIFKCLTFDLFKEKKKIEKDDERKANRFQDYG